VAENRFPVHIWSVSQVRPAEFYLLNLSPERPRPGPSDGDRAGTFGQRRGPDRAWHEFNAKRPLQAHVTPVRNALRYNPPEGSSKIGTYGSWLAAVYEDTLFVQHVKYDPSAHYPDRSSVQLYASKDYAELETLSPSVPLPGGESVANTVRWVLAERPSGASAEELARLAAESGR
jgi:hypothetical protein